MVNLKSNIKTCDIIKFSPQTIWSMIHTNTGNGASKNVFFCQLLNNLSYISSSKKTQKWNYSEARSLLTLDAMPFFNAYLWSSRGVMLCILITQKNLKSSHLISLGLCPSQISHSRLLRVQRKCRHSFSVLALHFQ